MAIESQEWSKVGSGQDRVTTIFRDGSSRDATRREDGGITVTDRSNTGVEKTGEGVTGVFGTLTSAKRLG
ncbi:MAG: hypothetical protein WCI36_00535 [bacterium]